MAQRGLLYVFTSPSIFICDLLKIPLCLLPHGILHIFFVTYFLFSTECTNPCFYGSFPSKSAASKVKSAHRRSLINICKMNE